MERYLVTIGSDVIEVDAVDHQQAKYKAAEIFKTNHSLDVYASDIVPYAHAVKVKPAFDPEMSTRELIALLRKVGKPVGKA